MATNGKDTIYIDIDDEITTIIDKVHSAEEKIVALVLPKRATVLQSIVNMKLLKRAADNDKKNLVLITGEAGLLPLAGTVGLYVAKNLQTKPEIPGVIGQDDDDEVTDEFLDDDAEEITAATAGSRPVGELASAASKGKATATPALEEAIETLELDDELDDEIAPGVDIADDAAAAAATKKSKKKKKNKKLAIPNFERFRLLLILGVILLIGLAVFGYFAAVVLPKASVAITTDTSNINSNLSLTADTGAKVVDATNLIVPAQVQSVQKNGSQQVPSTGKINNGQKATGTVTVSGQCTKKPDPVSQGIGVSSGGLTFITTDTLTFKPTFDQNNNVVCSGTVPVVAQQGGTQYNLAAGSTFTVAGYPSYSGSNDAVFTGGTDNNVQTVVQADIDNATQKIAAQNTDAIKQQLEQQLTQAGEYPLAATFNIGTPTTTNSAAVGDQVSTVTVTQATTYTMFGVKQSDLKTLVDADIKDKIDPSKQIILSEGIDKAVFHINSASATSLQLTMATTATAGPDLKVDDVKKAIAGKKSGQVITLLKADPGVTDVNVHMSPFWVTSIPNKPAKVTVTFQKAQ